MDDSGALQVRSSYADRLSEDWAERESKFRERIEAAEKTTKSLAPPPAQENKGF
jgi:hypothetical protein